MLFVLLVKYTVNPVSDLKFIKLNLLQQKQAFYASAEEFQDLIKDVLSWDIRSLSQRLRPHEVTIESKGDGYGRKAVKDCRNKED